MPIYHVTTPNGGRLIEAANAHQAIRHVVKHTITAKTVTATELVPLMQGGMQVENTAYVDKAMDEQQTE